MPWCFIIASMHWLSGNDISNFHILDSKTLYSSILYIVQNKPVHFHYYLCIKYDIPFLLIEMDMDKVWCPMKQVVQFQWIPNVSYTSNQTYKIYSLKEKKCSS